jgi:Flp pilus assembly protein TadD
MSSCNWVLAALLVVGCGGGTQLIRDDQEYQSVLQRVDQKTRGPLTALREGQELSSEQSQALYEALQDIDALIAFAPDKYGLYILRSLALRGQGRSAEAHRALEQALLLAPAEPSEEDKVALSQALTQLAADAFDKHDWKGAEQYSRQAVELAPNDPEAHVNLASALVQLGRTKDARTSASRALGLDPQSGRAKQLLKLLKGR